MPLNDRQWTDLAQDLRRAVARAAPDWTDTTTHDPGTTILQLLAFVLSDLRFRTTAPSPAHRTLARELVQRATALAATFDGHGAAGEPQLCGAGLQRVDYFAGMLLGVDDFRAEQEYVLRRLDRRNRLLGAGIVAGLDVAVPAKGGGAQVVVAPGLAFDPAGREIFLDSPCVLALPTLGTQLLVLLAYRERPCRNVAMPTSEPTGTNDDASTATRPTRIVETFDATLAPTPAADAVAIARLRRARGKWRVDATFKPARVPRAA